MKYSSMYIPALKEHVQENEALNYKLLHRAGYIRKSSAGAYTFLPLGARTIDKLQERLSGALESMDYFRLQPLSAQSLDELFSLLAAGRLSYKELPIGTWFIKEQTLNHIRPRLGLLHSKVFLKLSGFKLMRDMEEMEEEVGKLQKLWMDMAEAFGINVLKADMLSEFTAGSKDHMLFWHYDSGEDSVLRCTKCGMTATADSIACLPEKDEAGAVGALQEVHTPAVKTIQEVAAYLGVQTKSIVKTLIYKADDKFIAVLIRGDRELSEVKLKNLINCVTLAPASFEEVYEVTEAEVGFAGPIGIKAEVICDHEVAAMKAMVVGANRTDYHFINVCINRDFTASKIADIRCAAAADPCPECGGSIDKIDGFALGTLRKRGAAYNERQALMYQNSNGSASPMCILDFEWNLYRLLAAVIESGNDEAGIIMSAAIAPFDIIVMPVHRDNEEQMKAACAIYEKLREKGFDVILDDRDQRVTAKFKDSELLGIPLRITVGRKIAEGIIEVKPRKGTMSEILAEDLMSYIADCEESYAGKI